MIVYTVVYAVVILLVLYLLNVFPFRRELFTKTAEFQEQDNTEFRGINLLGVNSDDGHFAAQDSRVCRDICDRNPECKGYSFYKPGQRCYMFMSGDFVAGRPGFYSGKKISS